MACAKCNSIHARDTGLVTLTQPFQTETPEEPDVLPGTVVLECALQELTGVRNTCTHGPLEYLYSDAVLQYHFRTDRHGQRPTAMRCDGAMPQYLLWEGSNTPTRIAILEYVHVYVHVCTGPRVLE